MHTHRSTRRAYSSILILRMRSSLTLSNERRSPSSSAMRACRVVSVRRAHDVSQQRTHPHLSPLDLPLVSVSFIPPPFCLEEVKDAGEREVLAALGWKGNF